MNEISTTDVFDQWFGAIRDRVIKLRIQVRIDRAEDGNFGDCKPVRDGVSEMRIHTGAGHRIYFKQIGQKIYILLAGGDKSSQSKDIEAALVLAKKIGNEPL